MFVRMYMYICTHKSQQYSCTGWQRLIGSPKLQIIFHKRATNIGHFGGKWPIKIRDPMSLRHPVLHGKCSSELTFENIYQSTFCGIPPSLLHELRFVTYFIHVCDMARLYMWQDSLVMCGMLELLHELRFMTYSCAWHGSFVRVTWLINTCAECRPHCRTNWGSWRTHVCGMACLYVWHDAFTV